MNERLHLIDQVSIEPVLKARTRAFFKHRYPLSEAGQDLRVYLEASIKEGDKKRVETITEELPTVENPQSHLFLDLDIDPATEESLFGWNNLANVQVTKGCIHKCTFCAAGASPIVERMPFSAVVKIAEVKKKYDDKVKSNIQNWFTLVESKTGQNLDSLVKSVSGFGKKDLEAVKYIRTNYPGFLEKLESLYFQNEPIRRILKGPGERNLFWYDYLSLLITLDTRRFSNSIANYYDSDPFDYWDLTFLHEDGTPAHFGDVFAILTSSVRPIHITTAGWSRRNKIAQLSIEKIIQLTEKDPYLIECPRLSVNPFEVIARRNFQEYLESMVSVVRMLNKLSTSTQILIFGSDVSKNYDFTQFIELVVNPLKQVIKDEGLTNCRPCEFTVSYFSGPMQEDPSYDRDIMACMPGIHIWPDGSIHYQGSAEANNSINSSVDKGTRPIPLNYNLYQLSSPFKFGGMSLNLNTR